MRWREELTKLLYARLDQVDLYDDDGILLTDRRIDEHPWLVPNYTDTGAAALIADSILASDWLARVKTAMLIDLLADLKASPIVTLAGKGGAYEHIEKSIAQNREKD